MILDINVDDRYYDADAIDQGRLARTFFKELAENIFTQSYRYWNWYNRFAGITEIPLLHSERNLYSIVGQRLAPSLRCTCQSGRCLCRSAMPVIHGYHASSRSAAHSEEQLIESLRNLIDRRSHAQLLVSTWTLPQGIEIQWDSQRCTFISIAGIVLTRKR